MSRKAAWVLRASVVFAAWVWIVLIRNMIVGNFSWSFKAIHIGLGLVSLAFAVATWKITSDSRRFTRAVERERNPPPERMKASELAVGAMRLGLRKARAAAGATATGATATGATETGATATGATATDNSVTGRPASSPAEQQPD
jgi:hypothetical protein